MFFRTSKRLSVSSSRSGSESPLVFASAPNADAEEWLKTWQGVLARNLVDSPVVAVDSETTVEEACDLLLSENLECLAVSNRQTSSPKATPYHGLFDFADVNAFLTLAATRHKLASEELREKPRVQEILATAKAGRVPIYLVSNLSEKNPLETLPYDANLVSLLGVFARGTHRVLIQSDCPATGYLGMVTDRRLLSWYVSYAHQTPAFLRYLANPLSSLSLPSMYLYFAVVAAKAGETVLDAMRLMSDEGVSTVAVTEEETGNLRSAVSVTDIGKIVVPAQSNQILSMPLHQFVALIKEPDGSTDGVDKFPVYSVSPSSTLFYTMQKLMATNAHRLFVTDDSALSSPTFPPSSTGNLSGIISTVDVLSLFARIANLPDVDPTRMQRHRRASSASSSLSSRSSDQGSGSFTMSDPRARSRSSSRTSLGRLSVSGASGASQGEATGRNVRSSTSSFEGFQWADRVPAPVASERK